MSFCESDAPPVRTIRTVATAAAPVRRSFTSPRNAKYGCASTRPRSSPSPATREERSVSAGDVYPWLKPGATTRSVPVTSPSALTSPQVKTPERVRRRLQHARQRARRHGARHRRELERRAGHGLPRRVVNHLPARTHLRRACAARESRARLARGDEGKPAEKAAKHAGHTDAFHHSVIPCHALRARARSPDSNCCTISTTRVG